MKKLLFVTLLAALCVQASAELLIYNMSSRENLGVLDPNSDGECPRVILKETIWLVLDVNSTDLLALECADVAAFGEGEVIADAYLFKSWSYDRVKYFATVQVDDIYAYRLDNDFVLVMDYCDTAVFMTGRAAASDAPASFSGYCIIEGTTYVGEGSCSARLSRTLRKKGEKLEWTTIEDVLDYLEGIQPGRAVEGDVCDPLGMEVVEG